jgi:hypothetical protein
VHDADQLPHTAHRPLGEILQQCVVPRDRVREIARQQLLAQRAVGCLELRHEAALEPRPQPLLESVDRLGRHVADENELLPRRVEVVEDVEQLLLRPLLAGDELHVVDEQHVGRPIAGAEALDLSFLERGDQLVDEQLRADAGHARRAVAATRELVADRVEQVRLPRARSGPR